jgi:hypothetical protein
VIELLWGLTMIVTVVQDFARAADAADEIGLAMRIEELWQVLTRHMPFPGDLGEGLSDRQPAGEEESEVVIVEPKIRPDQIPEAG